MRIWLFVSLILAFDALFLAWASSYISISKYEADIFFGNSGYLTQITKFSASLFGQNDFAIRAPFIFLHLLNALLVVFISKDIVKKREDIVLVLLIFILLPGVNTSALIVNKAGIIMFFTLVFLYSTRVFSRNAYYVLIPMAFLDNAFLYLFVSLLFYGYYKKEPMLIFIAGLSFVVNFYIFGFDDGGVPEGYFLDIFSIYAAIFSPLVFLFFIYAIYLQFEKSRDNLHMLWFVSTVSFIISLVLSLRQNIKIEDFAPYAVIFTPFVVYAFFNSYRVRLLEFRRTQKLLFGLVLITLAANTIVTFYNKPLYLLIKNPQKHFAYEYHFTKEIAQELLKMNIDRVVCQNKDFQKKLLFYGIKRGGDYILTQRVSNDYFKKIEFSFFGTNINSFYLIKK